MDDTPIAILPFLDNRPFSQNIGHVGREGTPHKPLLPDRLKEKKQNTAHKINVDCFKIKKKKKKKRSIIYIVCLCLCVCVVVSFVIQVKYKQKMCHTAFKAFDVW